MAHYETDLDLLDVANRNVSQAQAVELVGSGARVLDVGCATGYLARALQRRGCRVWGVDRDADAAEPARAHLEQLVIADIEDAPLTDHFEKGAFDVLVFGDVLEHTADPVRVLRDALPLLAEGGRVVCSIPNVTHGSLRLAVLQGAWTYTDTGLLDRTHLRFFDRAGVRSLHAEVGLAVDVLRGVVLDPLGTEVRVDADALPAGTIAWVRAQPDAYVYQFLTSARLAGPGDSLDLPELEPAVPVEEVRLDDQHAQRHRDELATLRQLEDLAARRGAEVEQLRHRLLTLRDQVIGLEATASTSTRRLQVAVKRLETAERKLRNREEALTRLRTRMRAARSGQQRSARTAKRLEAEVRTLRAELSATTGSTSWRVGRAITSPLRAVRRGR